MGKIWLMNPDPSKQCCGCAGKKGPCDTCFQCSGYMYDPNIESVLNGNGIPVNTIARVGSTSNCTVIFDDNNSTMITSSVPSDYTNANPNYFNYQLSIYSGDQITIYCQDLDPLPITEITIVSGQNQGVHWPTSKQTNQSAAGFFQMQVATQTGKKGGVVFYGFDMGNINIDTSGAWQNPNGNWGVFGQPTCTLTEGTIPQTVPPPVLSASFYFEQQREQGYELSTNYGQVQLPISPFLPFVNQVFLNSSRGTSAAGAQFLLLTGDNSSNPCPSIPPTPIDPLTIMQALPGMGYIQASFAVQNVWNCGDNQFDNPTGVKQCCINITSQNQGFISILDFNNNPVNISGRLVKLTALG